MVLQADPVTIQNQILNVGDKRLNMTILQLAEAVKAIAERNGKKVSLSVQEQDVQDRRNYMVSFEKIRSMLGFQAKTLIDAGIQEMVDNFNLNKYSHYRDQIYSNVATTKKVLPAFYDPMQAMRLYAPLQKASH